MPTQPLASIIMGTYNHAPYIEQALESCLSQETDFPFEIIVGDDASTDGTQDVARKWAEKYPQIVLSLQPKNSGGGKNFIDAMSLIRGKYVAYCEGDDFWTVPYKLQKQVHFLEENLDFSICCHRVKMHFEGSHKPENEQYVYKDLNSENPRIRDGVFYADEAIANYYFQTSSVCFRWIFSNGMPAWFEKRMLYDHFLFMLHAVEGKIKYFDESMSCWRRHMTGYSWLQTLDKGIFFQKELSDWLRIYQAMDQYFEKRFTWQIRERIVLAIREVVKNCLATNQLEQARCLLAGNKDYLNFILQNAVLIDACRLLYPKAQEFVPPWAFPASKQTPSIMPEKTVCTDTEPATEETLDVADFSKPYAEEEGLPTITVGDMLEFDLAVLPKPAKSVWNQWTDGLEYACFANFRAALSAYLWHNAITSLWLPSFVPPRVFDLTFPTQINRRLYHVNEDISISTDFLKQVQPGEGVLTICNFGRPTPPNLEKALLKRSDIFWIEDRAQALWPGKPSRAHAAIYSPRKVLGVPDGGILVGKGASAWQPSEAYQNTDRAVTLSKPLLERFESGNLPGAARLKRTVQTDYQYILPAGGLSRLTLEMLRRIPVNEVIRKRKENWATLYAMLARFALWPIPKPPFAPYGFLLLMPSSTLAMMAISLMAAKGVACARDWTILPFPPRASRATTMLASRILVLPCDHRYGETQMQAMAEELLNIIRGNINCAPRFAD